MYLETPRLLIDDLRPTDKQDYFDNIAHDRQVLATFICRYAPTLEGWDFSAYLGREDLFAIRLRSTGRLIGIISLFAEKDGSCEIGYGLGSAHWGMGYATEAVRRYVDHLFAAGYTTIYASYFVGNDASRRVMEKCGMTYHHYAPHEIQYLDVDRDLIYYAIHR